MSDIDQISKLLGELKSSVDTVVDGQKSVSKKIDNLNRSVITLEIRQLASEKIQLEQVSDIESIKQRLGPLEESKKKVDKAAASIWASLVFGVTAMATLLVNKLGKFIG